MTRGPRIEMTVERKQKVDPRFRRAGKKATKVQVDDRFKAMFTDTDFVAPVTVDKYGRPVSSQKEAENIRRFYRLEDDEEADLGNVVGNAKEEESFSSSSSEEEDEEEHLLMEDTLAEHPLVNTQVRMGDATRRLALVNMDWDQLRASDIYAFLHAFKPATGTIDSVTIFPSSFGKERMQREAVEGPPRDLFLKQEDSEESDEEERTRDDGQDYDEAALRKYQLERLRYYYAIIECDSAETAFHVYKACDGVEFERSANFLDLRFVPDEESFEEAEAKERCLELPSTYRGKADMVTAALQMSRVALTWDGDDPDRQAVTRELIGGKKEKRGDIREADLAAYLASPSEEDQSAFSGDEEELKMKYKNLLQEDGEDVFGRKDSKGGDKELQITFASAMREASSDEAFSQEEEELGDTPFAKYLKKRADKKTVKKAQAALEKETKIAEKKKNRKRKGRKEGLSDEEGQSKLELLLMDDVDDDEDDHRRKNKNKNKNKKKKQAEKDESIDLNDDRFSALFESSAFALDPTHPAFKSTKSTKAITKERQKRLKD